MAEESDLERTEPASPRRLEQAREEGQVVRSAELATFAVVMAGAAGLWLSGGALISDMQGLIREALAFPRDQVFDPGAMVDTLYGQMAHALIALLPFGLIVLIAPLCAPLLLSGWLFSPKVLVPDFARLDPLSGFQRMFSLHSIVELVKALAKAAVLMTAALWAVWLLKDDVLRLSVLPLPQAIAQTGSLLGLSFAALVAAMLIIVMIDIPFQLWSFHRRMRMTRDEVRRELRESEGDPQLKARVRSMQREVARRRMMAQVPKADVVITNPTRYAVALRYSGSKMRAPQVVAKGLNLVAAHIRELASEHRIPVVEAPPLARALYRHAELEREIPAALYTAVAEVLAYVYQLARYRAVGGTWPELPVALAVPSELDPGAEPA